ncbi:hypothetical protein [Geitlerinema sp. PCC 7407]|nr:hypothetical protein [Geitlerinema sp. PCC 7407]
MAQWGNSGLESRLTGCSPRDAPPKPQGRSPIEMRHAQTQSQSQNQRL